MSKHNYNQYSNRKNNRETFVGDETVNETNITPETPEVKMEVVNELPAQTPVIDVVQETVDTVTLPETVTGTVVNCAKLNVRAEASANAEVVDVLAVNTEIEINVEKSNNEWFNVCTASGINGYCMRKFVNANL